jgi:hypothetical protein
VFEKGAGALLKGVSSLFSPGFVFIDWSESMEATADSATSVEYPDCEKRCCSRSRLCSCQVSTKDRISRTRARSVLVCVADCRGRLHAAK